MALYVDTEPVPPAGVDWTITVPGEYLYDVIGITATMTTGGLSSLICSDASGNNRDGTFFTFGGPFPPYVPGPVNGDDALEWEATGPIAQAIIDCDGTEADWTTPFTFVWWSRAAVDTAQQQIYYRADGGGGFRLLQIALQPDGAANHRFELRGGTPATVQSDPIPNVNDGLPHYFAVRWDGTTAAFNFDGDMVPPAAACTAPANVGPMSQSRIGPGGPCSELIDEWAVFPSALTDDNLTTDIYNQFNDFDAYNAAVLNLAPSQYFHFDGHFPGGQRDVTLAVTDGTHTLMVDPLGVGQNGRTNLTDYSWTPQLGATTSSNNNSAVSIAVPRLILPAGYTVGVRTLDLNSGDQWSAPTLWWDSTLNDLLHGYARFDYGRGAHLKYHQIGTP